MWDVVCQLQLRTITTSSWQCASTSCPHDSALWGVSCPFLSKYDLYTATSAQQSTRRRISGGCADVFSIQYSSEQSTLFYHLRLERNTKTQYVDCLNKCHVSIPNIAIFRQKSFFQICYRYIIFNANLSPERGLLRSAYVNVAEQIAVVKRLLRILLCPRTLRMMVAIVIRGRRWFPAQDVKMDIFSVPE